jgi:hypothetical protein
MLQQKSLRVLSCPLWFKLLLSPMSLCLCGEELFSIEQLSDESYRVHRRPGHELPIISYPQAGDWRLKTVLFAASGDGFPGFLIGGAAALGFALIPELLTLGECQFHFYFAVFEIHAGGDQGESALLGFTDQLADFVLVNEEFTGAQRCMIEDVAMFVGADVRVEKPEFPIFD